MKLELEIDMLDDKPMSYEEMQSVITSSMQIFRDGWCNIPLPKPGHLGGVFTHEGQVGQWRIVDGRIDRLWINDISKSRGGY